MIWKITKKEFLLNIMTFKFTVGTALCVALVLVLVPVLLEDYFIEAGGIIQKDEMKTYFRDEIYMKEYNVEANIGRIPNVLQYDRGKYVHINYLNIDIKALAEISSYAKKILKKQRRISVDKIYKSQKSQCRLHPAR